MEQEQGANIPPIRTAKDKFTEHLVVVIGAASGIGRTTAQLFARQGATLVLVDIQEDGLKAVEHEIREAGHSGTAIHQMCDLTNEAEVNKTIDWILKAYGQIDVLADIAGIYPFHSPLDFPTKVYRRIMAVNVDATFFRVRAVLPHMQSRGYGRIVLTSSGTVQEPEQGLSVYVASKAAVVGLTRAAAVEAGPG